MKYSVLLLLAVVSIEVLLGKQCGILEEDRLDCYPEDNATEERCNNRNCCWNEKVTDKKMPFCFFPVDYEKFKVTEHQSDERYQNFTLSKENSDKRKAFSNAKVMINHETENRLRIKFYDASENRWEPQLDYAGPSESLKKKSFNIEFTQDYFGFKIERDQEEILEFTEYLRSSLILTDQILQITFKLNANTGFGLGEHRDHLNVNFNEWKRIPFWNRDQPPTKNGNLYGTHNFLMGLTSEGKAFGIFFLNSNAHEVALQPGNIITYRTTGGVLDFYLFAGTSPSEVLKQYHEFIGLPHLPPRWSLGYQLSRYGYKDTKHASIVYGRNSELGMKGFWIDIDYMDKYKDWTLDHTAFKGYDQFVYGIRDHDKVRHVIIADPGIHIEDNYSPYEQAKRMGIFINDSKTESPIIGKVWPGEVNYPDFSHPSALEWWHWCASQFNETLNFDGLWIDMNEPSNFYDGSKDGCDPNNKLDNPEYVPLVFDGTLHAKTICPSSRHHDTTHYNKHNLYGLYEAQVTRKVLEKMNPNERPFVLTRSSFAGSGRYTAHWTGDNSATWEDLRASIIQVINFNIFGIPMVGADVCGFIGDTTEELCTRWHQLGVYQPFFRNHNTKEAIDQDPASFSKTTASLIKTTMYQRESFQLDLYSLLFDAHLYGGSVVNPMAFVFPEDPATHNLEKQYMIGECRLIAPVTEPGQKTINLYLPKGLWYSDYEGKIVVSKGEKTTIDVKEYGVQMYYRGGCVIFWPYQDKRYIFKVYLDSFEKDGKAKGHLYLDDGSLEEKNTLKINLVAENQTLEITPQNISGNYGSDEFIEEIVIYNIKTEPKRVTINGRDFSEFQFYNQKLTLDRIDFKISEKYTINWK